MNPRQLLYPGHAVKLPSPDLDAIAPGAVMTTAPF